MACAVGIAVVVIAGCSRSSGPPGAPAPGESSEPVAPGPPPAPAPEVVAPSPAAPTGRRALQAPHAVRSWAEVRRQAAERLVAANPDITYMGQVPEALLAIPVLEIELNGDGSVRRIGVLRPPRQAKDTLQIAADAVRRAAPFGDVSRLPRPWKFVETFLFDDDRRFKPRTLD
ncbi:MAG: hypothetical protein ABI641_11285 [Caldimonas sp.]